MLVVWGCYLATSKGAWMGEGCANAGQCAVMEHMSRELGAVFVYLEQNLKAFTGHRFA